MRKEYVKLGVSAVFLVVVFVCSLVWGQHVDRSVESVALSVPVESVGSSTSSTAPAPVATVTTVNVPVTPVPVPVPTTAKPVPTTVPVSVSTTVQPVERVAPTTSPAPVVPTGGLPPFLVCVRNRESRGNYSIVNPSSGAGGAFQFMPSTWQALGFAARYGVSRAEYASPAQQDAAAIETYVKYGRQPWEGPGC